MAGHNKWSKVKHIKGAADKKRGKLFSKLAKEISVAARDGGGDPDLNARLRQAINNAKKQSVPGDTIERAIKKGTGEIEGSAFEETCYEGYAPGGVALMVEIVTDNKNRSAADVRSIFNKNNGSLGSTGSVAYMFERKGEITISADRFDAEKMLELAMEAGAEDLDSDEEHHTLYTAHDELSVVATELENLGVEIESQRLIQIPQNTVEVPDSSTASQVLRLYEALDDYDDTQNVYANFDIPEGVMAELGSRN